MFTGIIQSIGTIESVSRKGDDLSLNIDLSGMVVASIQLGDSIAVNGVCLTVIKLEDGIARFDVSVESLSRTLIGDYHSGRKVNLELALTPTTRLGGHLVSGHVDGIGHLCEIIPDARSVRMCFETERELGKFIAEKGSISIDGISLTVNSVEDAEKTRFEVNIVPHTLERTTLGDLKIGAAVHLEVDIIARYLHRLLSERS